jgi:hypothetical protein
MKVLGVDVGEQSSDFLGVEHGWETVLGLGSQDPEDVPVALKDVLVDELDAAIADAHGLGGPLADVPAVEEAVLEFLLGDRIRDFACELREHADGSGVSLLGLPLCR